MNQRLPTNNGKANYRTEATHDGTANESKQRSEISKRTVFIFILIHFIHSNTRLACSKGKPNGKPTNVQTIVQTASIIASQTIVQMASRIANQTIVQMTSRTASQHTVQNGKQNNKPSDTRTACTKRQAEQQAK